VDVDEVGRHHAERGEGDGPADHQKEDAQTVEVIAKGAAGVVGHVAVDPAAGDDHVERKRGEVDGDEPQGACDHGGIMARSPAPNKNMFYLLRRPRFRGSVIA
jgi:hypothetical protein